MERQSLWRGHFISLLFAFLLYTCSNSNGIEKDGLKVVHFQGTDVVRQTIEYKNGKKNGFFTEYYRDGKIKAKQYFIDNQKDDTSLMFHENGQLRSLQTYKNKLKDGCWKEFNKKGKLYSEIYFKKDLLDSTSTIYTYHTGKVLTQITYKNGLKNGLERRYYNNGKLRSNAYFDMGRACMGTEEW
jgi:antitoxin component YwqK of YwqJK toxin-antitoxin module